MVPLPLIDILLTSAFSRGLWQPQTIALTPMHHLTYIGTLMQYFPQQKKKNEIKYNSGAEAHQATSFVVSTDGMLGREANFLLEKG